MRSASSESSSSTSKRQSVSGRRIRYRRAAATSRACLAAVTLSAAPPKRRSPPVAHLGEHQRAALLGHEVDFAVPAAPVARQHAQARLAQQFRAQFLGSRAGPVHGSLNGPPPRKVDPAFVHASGTLYVVATPIGNLADSSPRSIEILRAADLIACEDTRTSRTLLAHHGIAARTVALHAHNEREAGAEAAARAARGQQRRAGERRRHAGVSDPGALLVAAAHREGLRVVPVPGPERRDRRLVGFGLRGRRASSSSVSCPRKEVQSRNWTPPGR